MAQRVASRGGSSNGHAPLCVKDKRKAQAAAVQAAASAANPSMTPGRAGTNGHAMNGSSHSRCEQNGHAHKDGRSGGGGGMCNGSGGAGLDTNSGTGQEDSGRNARQNSTNGVVNTRPVVEIERAEIIRLASQYTPCAGCSAAVKGLLQRPIEELRMVNAVMEESEGAERRKAAGDRRRGKGGGNGNGGRGGDSRHHQHSNGNWANEPLPSANDTDGGCQHTCSHHPGGESHFHSHGHHHHHHHSALTVNLPLPVVEPSRALCLREAYLTDRARLDQLLETFPLEGLMKKVQPKGVTLRCEIHRRNGGHSTADGWEWEEAWDRLPADMRGKVAAIDVDTLEAAMHQATSTHRFCADCKHNVVTAFDILTCKCDLADIDNEDEFLPDLFWPFAGRIGPVPGDITGQKALLSCPLEDVEELICWHEDFDSREYTRSSQRHAATLEHGQREIRSIVGSVLLTQLRTNYHNHLAQVQGEQYLFALVLHAIRTRIEGSGPGLRNGAGGAGSAWGAGFGGGGPSACPRCGGAADPSCQICHGTGVSLSELGFDGDNGDKKAKTKSKKKRERKARAKAAKKCQQEGDAVDGVVGDSAAGMECNGHGSGGGSGNDHAPHTTARTSKTQGQRRKPSAAAAATAGRRRAGSAHKAPAVGGVSIGARTRAGSSGMESAGSLLSMLGSGGGGEGEGDEQEDDSGDEGIDEDLIREMERLKLMKRKTDVQRSRAALRSSLQKNFDQLLVSSTKDGAGSSHT